MSAKKIRKRAGPRGAGGRATPPDGSSSARSLMEMARKQTLGRSVRRPDGAFGGKSRKPLVRTDGQVKVDLTSFNPQRSDGTREGIPSPTLIIIGRRPPVCQAAKRTRPVEIPIRSRACSKRMRSLTACAAPYRDFDRPVVAERTAAYQSEPRGWPSLGKRARLHVSWLTPEFTRRILPSPRPTIMPPA
jgi:hypothetical protein